MRNIERHVNVNLSAPATNGPVGLAIWQQFGVHAYNQWEKTRVYFCQEGEWMMWLRMKKITSFPNDVFDAVNDSKLEKYLK